MTKKGLIMVNGQQKYNCYSDGECKKAFVKDDFIQKDGKFVKNGYTVIFYFDCSEKKTHFASFDEAEKAMFNWCK